MGVPNHPMNPASSWPVIGRSRRQAGLLVVIATYNERENIAPVIRAVKKHARRCDILVVDDGSPDGTGQAADAIAKRDLHVFVMHRQGKLGLGTALRQGLQWGLDRGYPLLMTIDADLSHPPDRIPVILRKIRDHDMVMGSRYVAGGDFIDWGWRRRLNSAVAQAVLKVLLGVRSKDCTTGFKCYRAALLKRLGVDRFLSRGYVFYAEVTYRAECAGARLTEIPITFANREYGESKLNVGEILHFLRVVFELRWLHLWGRLV